MLRSLEIIIPDEEIFKYSSDSVEEDLFADLSPSDRFIFDIEPLDISEMPEFLDEIEVEPFICDNPPVAINAKFIANLFVRARKEGTFFCKVQNLWVTIDPFKRVKANKPPRCDIRHLAKFITPRKYFNIIFMAKPNENWKRFSFNGEKLVSAKSNKPIKIF